MSGILTYALHYEGEFNKNSLGAVSEGAKLAKEIGGDAAVVVVGGDDLTDDLCASLGKYGATKVYRAKAPRASAPRSSTRWPRSSPTRATPTRCSAAACSASRSARASPPA